MTLVQAAGREHDARHRAFAEEVAAAGAKVLASEPLSDQATRFRPDYDAPDVPPIVTDGPFTESKEIVLGFYLLEVWDEDQARRLAARCPTVGYIELRRAWLPELG